LGNKALTSYPSESDAAQPGHNANKQFGKKEGIRLTNAERCEYWMRQYADSARRQTSGKRALGGTKIRAGQICCGCMAPLPVPHTMGVQRCELCRLPPTRRIFMSFIHQEGWHCKFLDWDLMTPLPRELRFRDPRKICETARRGHGLRDEKARLSLDQAIKSGSGGVWLHLTQAQYQALKSSNNVTGTGTQGDAHNAK